MATLFTRGIINITFFSMCVSTAYWKLGMLDRLKEQFGSLLALQTLMFFEGAAIRLHRSWLETPPTPVLTAPPHPPAWCLAEHRPLLRTPERNPSVWEACSGSRRPPQPRPKLRMFPSHPSGTASSRTSAIAPRATPSSSSGATRGKAADAPNKHAPLPPPPSLSQRIPLILACRRRYMTYEEHKEAWGYGGKDIKDDGLIYSIHKAFTLLLLAPYCIWTFDSARRLGRSEYYLHPTRESELALATGGA